MRWFGIIWTVLLLVPRVGDAAPESEVLENPVIAVLSIKGELNQRQLDTLTDWVREAAKKQVPKATILTTEKVTQLLDTNPDLRRKCEDAQFRGNVLNLGRLLKANYVVTGDVTRFGDLITLALRLHDTVNNDPIGLQKVVARRLEELPVKIEGAAAVLFSSLSSKHLDLEVMLKAKLLRPKGERDPDFSVQVKLNAETYRHGEELKLTVRCSRACYLTIFNIYGDETASVLYPNPNLAQRRVKPDETITLPPRGSDWTMPVGLLPGQKSARELLFVVALSEPTPFPGATAIREEGQLTLTEGVKAINQWFQEVKAAHYAESINPYRVVRR